MDRRYYLLKIGVLFAALVTAWLTSGMESTRAAHDVNLARYSAPATIEAAAWDTTARFARAVARLINASAQR